MKYRVLRDLSDGYRRGEVIDATELKDYAIEPLLRVRAIAPVAWPPLAILPGWGWKASRLSKAGVISVGELLDADSAALGEAIGVKAETVDRWREEAVVDAEVQIAERIKRPCCGRNR